MIRKLVRQMLLAQIFSALTVSLCLLIDNIMIGRFLGVEAIAAYGLANPILLVIGAIGTMLSAGVQVACSKSLGQGSQEKTNAGYSSALVLTAGISLALMAVVLLFRSPLATAMGAGTQGELYDQTRDYMAGFILGAPGSMGALVLVPFMQMAGQSGLLIAAVLGMTVADIGLDLANVFIFHGGMFGMGLASSLSYYIALIIGAFYFLSKKSVFRFSRRLVTREKIAELFKSGVPAVFNMASSVILIFLLNKILLSCGGSEAVAAYSVLTTIGNSANCITTGIGDVSLTLAGIFYNEEDGTGLWELMRLLCRDSILLGLCVGVLLLIFAPLLVALFLPEAGQAQQMAILGVRLFAAGLIPCCINNALKNAYQATGRETMTEIVSLLEGAALPALAAFVLSRFLGTTGVWFYFVAGEVLMLALLVLYAFLRTKKPFWKDSSILLLKPDFGVSPDNLLEKDIHTLEEAAQAARETEEFCLARGQDARTSSHIALCIEEMTAYTIQHGFKRADAKRHLSVRVLRKPDHWMLRFRDDCDAFDPVHYIPGEGEDDLGIRLMLAMSDEVRYTYSLNLNNLALKFD